jgi:hypothetical protein
VHSLFTQRYENIPALFAQNAPDVRVEFSDSGVFRRARQRRALYNAFARTRDVRGFFIRHMAVNPYIEIAADGLSAKSHWCLRVRRTVPAEAAGWRHARSRAGRNVNAVQALQ